MNKYTKCPHCQKVVKVLKNGGMSNHKNAGETCEGSGQRVEAFIEGFLQNKYVAKDVNGNIVNTRKTDNEYNHVGSYELYGTKFTYSKKPLGDSYTLCKGESTPLTQLTLELVEEKIKEEIPFAFNLETEEEVQSVKEEEEVQPVKEEETKNMNKYARCPHCQKVYTLTQKGELPKHKRGGAKIFEEINGYTTLVGYEKDIVCEGSKKKAVNFIEGFDTNKYEVSVNGEVIYTRKTNREDYAFATAYKSKKSGKWGVKLSKNPLELGSSLTHDLYHAQVEKVEQKSFEWEDAPFAFSIVKEEEEVQPVKEEEEEVQPVNTFVYHGLTVSINRNDYARDWKEELSFFSTFGVHEIFHRDLYLAYSLLDMVEAIVENFNIPVKQAYDMFKTGFITITKEDEVQPKEEEKTMIVKRLSKKQIHFLKSVSSLDFSFTENGKWIEVHNAPKLIKELENTAKLTPSTERRFLVQLVRKIKGLNGDKVEIRTRKKRAQEKVKNKFTKAEQDLIDYCKAVSKDLKAHLQFMIKMGVYVKVCNNVLSKLNEPVKEEPVKEEPVKEEPVKEGLEIPVYTLLPSSLQSAIKRTCLDLIQKEDMKVNEATQSLEINAPASICALLKEEVLTCLDVHYDDSLDSVINMIEMELQA